MYTHSMCVYMGVEVTLAFCRGRHTDLTLVTFHSLEMGCEGRQGKELETPQNALCWAPGQGASCKIPPELFDQLVVGCPSIEKHATKK